VHQRTTYQEDEMISELTEAMIVNGVVLASVLASDLGSARKIGRARMLRPVLVAAVVPVFIQRPVTSGHGLIVELAGVVAGILGGLAAAALMRVYRSPETGRPVSSAGVAYAAFWTVVIAARAAFSYGSAHWFTDQIVSWAAAFHVAEAAIVDGLIFMAIAMVLVRTASMGVRASRLPAAASGAVPAGQASV
jgi:hypothetical protein